MFAQALARKETLLEKKFASNTLGVFLPPSKLLAVSSLSFPATDRDRARITGFNISLVLDSTANKYHRAVEKVNLCLPG